MKTIEVNAFEHMLQSITASEAITLKHHDLLIYSSGGQDKKFYKKVETNYDCEVLWSGWSGPRWSKIFSFIPGEAGVIKILKKNDFADLYYELAALSISDAIYIKKTLTPQLCEEVRAKTWSCDFKTYIRQDPSSFLMTAEAGETITKNGKEYYFYDYFFGTGINKKLASIIKAELSSLKTKDNADGP